MTHGFIQTPGRQRNYLSTRLVVFVYSHCTLSKGIKHGHNHYLTHWHRDKMDTIFQMTFSRAISWMKMCELRLRFHWTSLLKVQLTTFQYWFRWWLGACQVTSRSLYQWWLDYWRIYASLGFNELTIRRDNNIWMHQHVHRMERLYTYSILIESWSYLPSWFHIKTSDTFGLIDDS